MGRNRFQTKQFREEACKLVNESGYSVREAAKQLGVAPTTLWSWLTDRGMNKLRNEARQRELGDDPAVLKVRIKELEQHVQRLEMEKEILKKATAYFAREQT
jgi:transposase